MPRISVRPRPAAARLAAALLPCAWVALLGCASLAPDALPPGPAVWRAVPPRPDHGALFLVGSVHMGSDAEHELGPAVWGALERADELVVEVDVAGISAEEIARLQQRYGRLPPGRSLRQEVSPSTWQLLSDYLGKRGYDASRVAGLKPWFVALMVANIELGSAGYSDTQGVDVRLMREVGVGRPIVALETAASQLEMMDRLAPAAQELMLRDALARVGDYAGDTSAMMDAWRRGDEAEMERLVFSERVPELEAYYDLIFFQRNATMTSRLVELGSDGRTRLVVVGAGHMVGDRGIPALLERRGYEVRRVRRARDLEIP